MVEEIHLKIQNEFEKIRQLQKECQEAELKRQQLEGQRHENNIVKEELDRMKPGCDVFKLIGPLMIKQDLTEAKENINKRLQLISQEIKRAEDLIKYIDENIEIHKTQLERLEQRVQMKLATKS
ncbi:hypothetical protein TKK_0018356 [Trichogramma kaykai]